MMDTSHIFASSTLVSLASSRTTLESCSKAREGGDAISTQHRTSTVTSGDEEAAETKQRAVLDKLMPTYICKRASFAWTSVFLNMINAYRNAGAARASSKLLTCQCHHHQAEWDIATSSDGVDVASCSRRRKSGRRWENATRVERLSTRSTASVCR